MMHLENMLSMGKGASIGLWSNMRLRGWFSGLLTIKYTTKMMGYW